MYRIMVFFDEVFLKGDNRKAFISSLISNIQKVIRYSFNIDIKPIYHTKGYAIFDYDDKFDSLDDFDFVFSHIPGIAKYAKCKYISYELHKVDENYVLSLLKSHITEISSKWNKIDKFKINTKRHFKDFPITSQEFSILIANQIDDKYYVDLKNPDNTINIFITNGSFFIAEDISKGAGGLPIGKSGKALALISGGIDSPVAAYMMMTRGLDIDFIHFQNKTLMKDAVKDKIESLCKQLAKFKGKSKLIIVPFEKLQPKIVSNIDPAYRMMIYKYYMIKLSSLIAEKDKIIALVTGDSLAQVASQTLSNIFSLYATSSKLILSPLIGMSKREIIKVSSDLRLIDISSKAYPDCCSMMIAKNPVTNTRKRFIEKLVRSLEINNEQLNDIVDGSEIIEL